MTVDERSRPSIDIFESVTSQLTYRPQEPEAYRSVSVGVAQRTAPDVSERP